MSSYYQLHFVRDNLTQRVMYSHKHKRGNVALEFQFSLYNVKTHIGFNTAKFKTLLSLLSVLP